MACVNYFNGQTLTIHPIAHWFNIRTQERMKVREVILHIGPIPIVIPLKLFLDLPRDPVSQEGYVIAYHIS